MTQTWSVQALQFLGHCGCIWDDHSKDQCKPVPELPESRRLFAVFWTFLPQTEQARGGVLTPRRQRQENLSFKMGLDYKTKNKTLLRLLGAYHTGTPP